MFNKLLDRVRPVKRISVMLLILGPAFAYFAWFGPRASRDHAVIFQFEAPLTNVRRLTATWSAVGDGGEEALGGSTFDVAAAGSTRQFRTNVHAPDGDFWVDLEFERADGTQTLRKKTALGEGTTTILLSAPASSTP